MDTDKDYPLYRQQPEKLQTHAFLEDARNELFE
jgi:hypothetical protein